MDRLHGVDFEGGCYVGQEVVFVADAAPRHSRTPNGEGHSRGLVAGTRCCDSGRATSGRTHGFDGAATLVLRADRGGSSRRRARRGNGADSRRPRHPRRPIRMSFARSRSRRSHEPRSARLHADGLAAGARGPEKIQFIWLILTPQLGRAGV